MQGTLPSDCCCLLRYAELCCDVMLCTCMLSCTAALHRIPATSCATCMQHTGANVVVYTSKLVTRPFVSQRSRLTEICKGERAIQASHIVHAYYSLLQNCISTSGAAAWHILQVDGRPQTSCRALEGCMLHAACLPKPWQCSHCSAAISCFAV